MAQLLGLIIISFFVTSLVLVPFIDLLYYLRNKFITKSSRESSGFKPDKDSNTPIHDQLMKSDFSTPHGGGIIIIPVLIILSGLVLFIRETSLNFELVILIFTLLSFGLLGFVDDVRHIGHTQEGKFKGLSIRVIFPIQLILAFVISSSLYFGLGFDSIYLPIIGNVALGLLYIPLGTLAIVSFANAINISDGLDGLSTGLLTICLVAFLVLAHAVFNTTLSIFVGIWLGALIAYLYFNVFPARVYLGDAGAFGFGATLAVIGLLTGKIVGLGVIGGIYMIILGSSFIQILSKRFFGRKVFPVAPIHMYFKYIGWPEPKIVTRFWLAGAMFAVFGLWLALISR